MKELYRKDPASHSGPESCDADREDCSEALTGEVAGEVLSHEIREPVMPTPLSEAEGNSPQIDKARDVGKRRGRRMCIPLIFESNDGGHPLRRASMATVIE